MSPTEEHRIGDTGEHAVSGARAVRLRRQRRQQRLRRLRALLALGLIAFAVGAIIGSSRSGLSPSTLASRFVSQWVHGDFTRMYGEIDPAARRSVTQKRFVRIYQDTRTTATFTAARVSGAAKTGAGGVVEVPVHVDTRLFGTITANFSLPVLNLPEGPRVDWSDALTFPGLHSGERLSRRMKLPTRAALLTREGSLLASGAAEAAGRRYSPLGEYATAVLGEVGAIPQAQRTALESDGVPDKAIVGVSGLELALDSQLRGTPGGELLAGSHVLARAKPHPAKAVRTTISRAVQEAAVNALGNQYGGIVVLAPATGQILAVAGIGLESVQPPGSTFKMITVTAGLQAGVTNTSKTYPIESHATLDGVTLGNSEGESCGGKLYEAFAESCNSVFAPMGVAVGAKRLVAMAKRFGFDAPSAITGAVESTIPPASQIHGELAVGSSALGQDRDSASPLEMALVAATIADGGRRPRPTFTPVGAKQASHSSTPVTTAKIAHTVRQFMIDVVNFGTGTSAAIPGVEVAGKTGTAELRSTPQCSAIGASCTSKEREEAESPENTDAWFAAFAPAKHPQVAVCVMLVKDGFGGDTAAPVARAVIEATLAAHL